MAPGVICSLPLWRCLMRRRWVIVGITSIVLVGAGTLVHTERKNRQLAKHAAAVRIRAEQGDAQAQLELGFMYSKGKGVPQDFVQAVRWYRKSAEQGYANAQYNLCHAYLDGRGVPQDYKEAERWCRRAAEQGNARGQVGLGILY